MHPPQTSKEIQILIKRITALTRFITRSGDVCLPFFKILKRQKKIEWDEECNMKFLKLNKYLSNPPIMSRSVVGEHLFLYLAATGGAVSVAP
jgi:hypothetical protein